MEPRTLRVLVADDDRDTVHTLTVLLEGHGYTVHGVHSGKDVLVVAPIFRPDALILDIGMPGLDGYEVARRLRALKRERPLRIVAITGWGQEADRARSREAGFDVHLVKPVDAGLLVRVLEERNGATLH